VRPLRPLALLLPLAAVLLLGAPAWAEKADVAAQKLREKAAKAWVALAEYLTGRGMRSEAAAALDQAAAIDPEGGAAVSARKAVDALSADAPLDDEAKGRRDKVAQEAAKAWDKLVDLLGGALDEPPAAQALWRALSLQETKPRLAKWVEAAKKSICLVEAPGHPLAAWVALPSSWKAGKSYPVLVTVDGAGANFVQNVLQFRGLRGSREVVIVTPYALSCTNEIQRGKFPLYSRELLKEHEDQMKRVDFDVEGLARVLDVVRERFGGEEKAMITGFSGGGFLAYAFTFRKPERVRLLAPACPNYRRDLASSGVKVEGGGPTVRIFTGANDQYKDAVGSEHGIEHQTDVAVEALKSLGYTDLKRTMLPGVGHSNCSLQVFSAVDEVVGKR
jgi:predicted esterase